MEKLESTMESQTRTGRRITLTRRFFTVAGPGASSGGGGLNGCDLLRTIKYF